MVLNLLLCKEQPPYLVDLLFTCFPFSFMEGENSVTEAEVAVTVPPATWPALPPASLRPTRDPTEKARTRAGSAGLTSSLELMDPHRQAGRQAGGMEKAGGGGRRQQDQCYCKVTLLADTRQQRHQRTRLDIQCLPTPTFTTS